jgi:D-ribose pyranose/furanose isomerase RbsD
MVPSRDSIVAIAHQNSLDRSQVACNSSTFPSTNSSRSINLLGLLSCYQYLASPMANPNQQVTHVLSNEQYEANKARISQLKEYVNAFEIQNEVGHETFVMMQQELERRVREGERAQYVHNTLCVC